MKAETIKTLKESLAKTKNEANKLFASESAKHDLFVTPYGSDNESLYRLASTSGTTYYVGDKESCYSRMDELLLFALTGY